MERNHYFENYINNLQKDIFLFAFDANYDIVKFISSYMKSNIRKEMDKPYTSWHNQPAPRIVEEIVLDKSITKVKEQTINRDAVEWLGYFYSKWHFISGESSKIIVRFLPPTNGLKNYYTLHQLDETVAIEKCKRTYNLSRNAHRKDEDENNEESKKRYDNPVYYSFLAPRILYKLTKDPRYNELNYVGDVSDYDFIDKTNNEGLKCDVIFSKNGDSIIKRFIDSNTLVSKVSRKPDSLIYFCFVFSYYYEVDGNGDEKLLIDISKLKKEFPPNKREFERVYFYLLGKLYEITPSNELYIYSIPFSKKERIGILNRMRMLGL